ncbi:hypothetical protein BDV93DRAFT_509342 [Ceratobasidium sp. AG-I]|nr:hypothetical protein BDV93DRAFT_509342 [Ceratobasidium sp. AG-I]
MSQTEELLLPLIPVRSELLEDELGLGSGSSQQTNTYTVSFSFSFDFMMALSDTLLAAVALRVISTFIAAGGFVASLAVILLAPYFPSLVATAPEQVAPPPLGPPVATSSPYRRNSTKPPMRRRPSPVSITVSVRRDPSIRPIIERRDSASPSTYQPNRRVSFSPQSSSTSVPTLPDIVPSSGPVTRLREQEREGEHAFILPTPPASITSVSSEADDTETMDDFGLGVSASPSVGKRGRRTFPFVGRRKDKGKEVAGEGEASMKEFGLFGDRRSRRRAQSLGYVVEGEMAGNAKSAGTGAGNPSPLSTAQVLRESEGETSGRDDRVEKDARRRSGLTFQDFKAAFGKRERERRGSASPGLGTYYLSTTAPLAADGETAASAPRAAASLGLGRPSSMQAQVSPRSASDGSTRRKSMPLRLDTDVDLGERAEVQSPFTRASQSPPRQPQPSLFVGEVVIRNESGRRRTRSSAIPGLYTDAEVVRRW